MADRFWADADHSVSTVLYQPDAEDHPDTDAPLSTGPRRWALEIAGEYALVIDGSLDQFEEILHRALAMVTSAQTLGQPHESTT